jgi:hypothetical protein
MSVSAFPPAPTNTKCDMMASAGLGLDRKHGTPLDSSGTANVTTHDPHNLPAGTSNWVLVTHSTNWRGVTFAELPPIPTIFIPEGYLLPLPVEGDEFHVTDCATQWNFAGRVSTGAPDRS